MLRGRGDWLIALALGLSVITYWNPNSSSKAGASVELPSSIEEFIISFEGFHAAPYDDYQQWSWGYGTKAPGPNAGTITEDQALVELRRAIAAKAEEVDRLVTVDLNDNQRMALISFQYNTGGLEGSTLLKEINSKNWEAAAQEFGYWIHAEENGAMIRLPGLIDRRQREASLFTGK